MEKYATKDFLQKKVQQEKGKGSQKADREQLAKKILTTLSKFDGNMIKAFAQEIGYFEKHEKITSQNMLNFLTFDYLGTPAANSNKFIQLVKAQEKKIEVVAEEVAVAAETTSSQDMAQMKQIVDGLPQNLQGLGGSANIINQIKADFASGKYAQAVDRSMASFRSLSREDLRLQVKSQLEGKVIGNIFNDYPHLLELYLDFLQDKLALSSAARILENRDKLILFGAINLALFFLSWLVKKIWLRKEENFFVALKWGMVISLTIFTIRMGVLVYFYGAELNPSFQLVKNFIKVQFFS